MSLGFSTRYPVIFIAAVWLILAAASPVSAADDPARSRVLVLAPLTSHYFEDDRYQGLFRKDLENRWNNRVEMRHLDSKLHDPGHQLKIRQILEDLADDPTLAAVVISEAPAGCLEGISRLKTLRPDLFVMVIDPHESLERMGHTASLTLALNQQARGFLYPTMAARLGANNLVYLSFPRHQDIPALGRQYRVLSAVARDMGLNLLTDFNGPDPMIATAEVLKNYLRLTVERHIGLYGPETAFITPSATYSDLLAPIIAQTGGALLEPNHPNTLLGLPEALNLSSESMELFGHWQRILALLDEKYMEIKPAGRFTTWAYPYPHTAMLAMTDLAIAVIDEGIDIHDLKNVSKVLEKYSPNTKWQVIFHMDFTKDSLVPQVVLALQDTYWLGRGYQGFTRINIPSKYYRIR